MEKSACNNNCSNSDLILNIKRKAPRFKAGSDLSSKVNRIDVSVTEDHDEDWEIIGLNICFHTEVCSQDAEPPQE